MPITTTPTTISPCVLSVLHSDNGTDFINRCVSDARNQRWGSVTHEEAAHNNHAADCSQVATGAYEAPAEFGEEVLMVDLVDDGNQNQHAVVRFIGERMPA